MRILLSKDTDIGALVFKDGKAHEGVLLIDDLGSPETETELIVEALALWYAALSARGFVRAGRWGSRLVDGA